MICDREFCPIELRAKAMSEAIKGHSYMEVCEPCMLCSPNRAVCWERIVRWNKDKTAVIGVELRLKRRGEAA